MAADSPNPLTYFLAVPIRHKDLLGAVRHWSNLKIGIDMQQCWLKDLTEIQIKSLEIKQLPDKEIYYEREGKLFKVGSLLPSRAVPALLWTPIERGMPVQLPPINPNYFEPPAAIAMRLVASHQEQPAGAMIVPLTQLGYYLQDAPAIRTRRIQWLVLEGGKAALIGEPLLPIPAGDTYWRRGNFWIPSGYDFEYFALCAALDTIINADATAWVWWTTESRYFLLPKSEWQPLSRGAFRMSIGIGE